MKRITADLNDDLYRKLKLKCAIDGLTMREMITQALIVELGGVEVKAQRKGVDFNIRPKGEVKF